MKCFVLEGKKFVHLPEAEKGQFYSQNSYVFVCKYLYAPELAEDEELDEDDDQEDEKFLSHFNGTFLILNGKRFTKSEREKIVNREPVKGADAKEPMLLQTRTSGSIFTTRTVQVQCHPKSLNSEFCHILIV